MMVKCVKRYVCPNKPVTSDGCRFKFFYPNGGSYSGYWLKNQNHGFGAKISEERNCRYYANKKRPVGQLIYKGDWKQDKRTNSGSMIRKRGTDLETIYTGMWYDDQKVAEGIKYYTDGCVYYGEWLRNCRHGMGILWYVDGSIYLGEWKTDYKHGLGVLFYGRCFTPTTFLFLLLSSFRLSHSEWKSLRGTLCEGLQERRGHLLSHAHWSSPEGHLAQRQCQGISDAG